MLVYTSLLRRIPKHPRPSICSRRGLRENGQPRVCIRTLVRTHVPACRVQAFASTAAAYRRGRGINGHPEVIFESFKRGGSDLGKRKAKATCGAYMAFHVLLSVCHAYCRKCWRDRGCVCRSRHRFPARVQAARSTRPSEVAARARKKNLSAGGDRAKARTRKHNSSSAKRSGSSVRQKGGARARVGQPAGRGKSPTQVMSCQAMRRVVRTYDV